MSSRLEQLQSLNVPEAIIKLATSNHDEDLFFFRCGEPAANASYSYPENREAVVLWVCDSLVTAVRPCANQGLEYIAFNAGKPEEFDVIANSSQGCLAYLFSTLLQDEALDEDSIDLDDDLCSDETAVEEAMDDDDDEDEEEDDALFSGEDFITELKEAAETYHFQHLEELVELFTKHSLSPDFDSTLYDFITKLK